MGESDAALGYIVVADQHAVDEECVLENMAASYNAMQVPPRALLLSYCHLLRNLQGSGESKENAYS